MIEQQIKQFRALNEWFQSSQGLKVASEFIDELAPVKAHLKGESLIQLGNCGNNPWLKSFNYEQQWIVSPLALDHKIDLEASLNELPFNRDSIDCVVAPLTLEPYFNSYNLIDEIDRILKPMGFIVLLSLNPWSLWGAAMKFKLLHCYADNKVKMRTPFHINRIFLQRGYRQCSLSNFCYIPPVNSKDLLNKFNFLDEMGKMLWPFPSGFYCYIAQKYEIITPSLITQPVRGLKIENYKSSLQPATN